VEIAKRADAVILCVGENQKYSGEGNSRVDLTLTGVQSELVKEVCAVNANTAVVLFNGRPLVLSDINDVCPAILDMWFPGSEGGTAVANLLFGKVNPSGKLTMSFPKAVGQCPIYYNRTVTGRPKSKGENVHQPYSSNYLDCGNLPLYFFGEGLSYTTFEYESMTLDRKEMTADESITVSVTLRNAGERAGKETVQLYLRDVVSSTVRPIQELVAFEKVELAAGESKTLTFEIKEPMLRLWNTENEFVSEKGAFRISVGYADHMVCTEQFKLV
jgi:beta-glucosidase